MPIKEKDIGKILKALGIAGQTISGIAQAKEEKKRIKAEEERQKITDNILRERLKTAQEKNRLAELDRQEKANAIFARQTGSTGQIGDVPLGTTIPARGSSTRTAQQIIESAKVKSDRTVAPATPAPTFRGDLFAKAASDPATLIQAFSTIKNFPSIWNAAQDVGFVPTPPKVRGDLTPGEINSIWGIASKKFGTKWADFEPIDAVEQVNIIGRKNLGKRWVNQTAPYEVTVENIPWGRDVTRRIELTPASIKELQKAEKDRDNNIITQEQFLQEIEKAIASD